MTTGGDNGATRVDPIGREATPEAAPRVPAQYSPSASDHPDYQTTATAPAVVTPAPRGIRWGAVWAGAVIALATFVVLQLLFFALGWLDLGFTAQQGELAATVVSGVLALVAFFVGGLVAGAASPTVGRAEGLLQAVTMWALAVVGVVAITLAGGGALLGAAASAAAILTAPGPVDGEIVALARTVRDAAGWGALGLGLALVAAALGGVVGGPAGRGRHAQTERR